ncbi:MAG: hypothetical protein C4345_15595 [Chloroflexota bacterium]
MKRTRSWLMVVPEELVEAVDRLARRLGVSRGAIARLAIAEFLERRGLWTQRGEDRCEEEKRKEEEGL